MSESNVPRFDLPQTAVLNEAIVLYGLTALAHELDSPSAPASGAPKAAQGALPVAARPFYRFGGSVTDGEGVTQKATLGGKGAGLAELAHRGAPVPPGFTLPTDTCRKYLLTGVLPADDTLREGIAHIEAATGRKFGINLFVSVRSGAPDSMPGMMDTILNLGLNDDTVGVLADETGNIAFAHEAHARFLRSYVEIVRGVKKEKVAAMGGTALRNRVPADVWGQLQAAVEAVFRSWNSERAKAYRAHEGISDTVGTAVTVQAMVFGNMGEGSGTGVLFTRNPATGEPGIVGEYLANAQGEDVVAGVRTPAPLTSMADAPWYGALIETVTALELHFRDMQDVEFTVERGTLYLLQTRNAKRSARAMARIAVDLLREGVIDRATAAARIDARRLETLTRPTIDPEVL